MKNTYTEMLAINSEATPNVDEDDYEDETEDPDEERDDDDDNDSETNEIPGFETDAELDPDSLPASSGSTPQNATAVLEPASRSSVGSNPGSKNKRHHPYEASPPSGSQRKLGGPSKSVVQFTAKVLHTINAFITWPATPPGCNCDAHAVDIQYVFHLYMRGQEETPQMRHLSTNVVHLEDLDPNELYHYQVKYIFPNRTETAWSQEQNLDTDCRSSRR